MKPVILIIFLGMMAFAAMRNPNGPGPQLPSNSVKLGQLLFFDPILSKDYTVSCRSCHQPEFAFADNKPKSRGIGGQMTSRNTPSVMYPQQSLLFFWDGRAQTLEHQAFFPITHPAEMGITEKEVVKRLNDDPFYKRAFAKVFQSAVSMELVSFALADFQRSLSYFDSPYDRFYFGDDSAMSPDAIQGLDLFSGKAGCIRCHHLREMPNAVEEYRNIGLYNGEDFDDKGRFLITGDSADLGVFKSPQIRNIALTAPYMHNGAQKTLMEMIEYYNEPAKVVKNQINRDTALTPKLNLTDHEKKCLEAFLHALTDDSLDKKFAWFQEPPVRKKPSAAPQERKK